MFIFCPCTKKRTEAIKMDISPVLCAFRKYTIVLHTGDTCNIYKHKNFDRFCLRNNTNPHSYAFVWMEKCFSYNLTCIVFVVLCRLFLIIFRGEYWNGLSLYLYHRSKNIISIKTNSCGDGVHLIELVNYFNFCA